MKILIAYANGVISAVRSKKMTTLIYGITFLLSLIIAIPFRNIFGNLAGNSMALHSMLKDFDFTTYSDFMNHAGKAIHPLISAAIWLSVFYIIFTVFFSGGVLKILTEEKQKFSVKLFFASCGEFFFRFLRLAVYLLIVQAVIAIIIYLPLMFIINFVSSNAESEASLVYIFITGVLIHILLFLFFLIVGDYTKISLFKDDSRQVLKYFGVSFIFVLKHLFSTYVLYLLLLVAPLVLLAFYFLFDSIIGMVSALTILVMFLIQQIVIWTRIWIKIWILGSEIDMFVRLKIIDAEKLKAKKNIGKVSGDEKEGILGSTI